MQRSGAKGQSQAFRGAFDSGQSQNLVTPTHPPPHTPRVVVRHDVDAQQARQVPGVGGRTEWMIIQRAGSVTRVCMGSSIIKPPNTQPKETSSIPPTTTPPDPPPPPVHRQHLPQVDRIPVGVKHRRPRGPPPRVPKLQKRREAARAAAAAGPPRDVDPLDVRGGDARVAPFNGLDVHLAGAVHVGLDGVGGRRGGVERQLPLGRGVGGRG
jgi:hypothetical protein